MAKAKQNLMIIGWYLWPVLLLTKYLCCSSHNSFIKGGITLLSAFEYSVIIFDSRLSLICFPDVSISYFIFSMSSSSCLFLSFCCLSVTTNLSGEVNETGAFSLAGSKLLDICRWFSYFSFLALSLHGLQVSILLAFYLLAFHNLVTVDIPCYIFFVGYLQLSIAGIWFSFESHVFERYLLV